MKRIHHIPKIELKKYINQGKNYKEIAEIYKCSLWTILKRTKEYGLKGKGTTLGRKGKLNPVFKKGVKEKISKTLKKRYKEGAKLGARLIEKVACKIDYPCHRCEECKSVRSLRVHHIDGNQSNHLKTNLECLCGSCHISKHYQPYMQLQTKYHFHSAHSIPSVLECSEKHGHTYHLEVVIGNRLNKQGMVKPFGEVKMIVQENVIEKLDHKDIDKILDNSSAEFTVEWIFRILNEKLKGLKKVILWETETCCTIIEDKSFLTMLGE